MDGFLPTAAALAAADVIGKVLKNALANFTRGIKDLGRAMANVAGPLLSGLTRSIGQIAEQFVKPLTVALGDGFRRFMDVGSWLKPVTQKFAAAIAEWGGSVGGWLAPVGNAIGKTFSQMGSFAESWIKPITSRLGTSFGRLFDVEGTLKPLTRGMLNLSKSLGVVLAGAGAAAGAIAGLGSAMGVLVGKANPALMQQFSIVLNDAMAVIGHALVPVMGVLVEAMGVVRDTFVTFAGTIGNAIGAALQSLMPIFRIFMDIAGRVGQVVGRIMEAMVPVIAGVATAVTSILNAVQPIVNLLIDLMGDALAGALGVLASIVQAVTPVIVQLASVLGSVIGTITRWIRELLSFLGLDISEGGSGTEEGAGVGAAVRQAQFTSMSAFANKAYSTAAMAGTDPNRIAKDSLKKLTDIDSKVWDLPGRIAAALGDAITKSIPGGTAIASGMSTMGRIDDFASRSADFGARMAPSWTGSVGRGVGSIAGYSTGLVVGTLRELFD